MASLNLSTNGPSITKSYQSILSAPLPTGPAAASPSYGQWAIFAVQAPLVSAFQHDGGKESVLKVQSTGEGELQDFVEDFSDGRIQFGLVKIKDSNTALPKIVLVGWCGEGVPDRTKGYFTSHLASVAKLFQGYHIQITARSENDITPERIIQKVADSSGSKYSASTAQSTAAPKPGPRFPPVGGKPVFLPTQIGAGASPGFNPLTVRSRVSTDTGPVDQDGWGEDAPQVTRTQLEKVASAYVPTKVGLPGLAPQSAVSGNTASNNGYSDKPEAVRGAYQPIGKVDIEEIRRQARASGDARDDRPTPVKGAYEPVGKVDIAAIRARASQAPAISALEQEESMAEQDRPKSLSERSAAFQQSERLSSLPKPKIANKFGGSPSFSGTKAPVPSGFVPSANTSAAPVGVASRTFADEGGKTPAQIWAEKKARQSGSAGGLGAAGVFGQSNVGSSAGHTSIPAQASGDGGWKSGYTGKSWAPVTTSRTGQSAVSESHSTQNEQQANELQEREEPQEPLDAIRQRFSAAPPPMDVSSKPNAGSRANENPQAFTTTEESIADEEEPIRPSSPIRVAMPVGRGEEAQIQAQSPDRALQTPVPAEYPDSQTSVPARQEPQQVVEAAAPTATANMHKAIPSVPPEPSATTNGKRAVVQYDYDKAEDNEIDLKEGDIVTNIDMVDEDWWMGQNVAGESGLFPANYVELVEASEEAGGAPSAAQPQVHEVETPPAAVTAPATGSGKTATAQYDYEAAEDNELSFPDGATIINVEFPDDDWWLGEYDGKTGLFPSNYVQLDA